MLREGVSILQVNPEANESTYTSIDPDSCLVLPCASCGATPSSLSLSLFLPLPENLRVRNEDGRCESLDEFRRDSNRGVEIKLPCLEPEADED